MSELSFTYRRRLHERAFEQYGYITTRDARRLDVPRNALDQIVHRGGLNRVAHGVYRFDDIPVTSRDGFMEAVLAVGDDAFLMADSVLALHDLALVNPRRLRVGVPRRVRVRLPSTIHVIRRTVPPEDLTIFEGIPCTTVARALVDCIGIVMRDRLAEAAREAAERGLLRRSQAAVVLEKVGVPP